MKRKDILIISTADWDNPIQTNKQYVSKELSKLGFRVLYVESLGIRKIIIKRRDFYRVLKRIKKLFNPITKVKEEIYTISPIIIPGARNKFNIFLNKILFNFQLNNALRFLNFKKQVIWSYNPLTSIYIDLDKFKTKIYHAVDSIEYQPNMPKKLIIENEKILASKVDKVFVTSKTLLTKLSRYNSNISYYGNVCDFEHFSRSRKIKNQDIPIELKKIKKPIVGFIGSLSEYKLDFDLIIKVSKKLKNISFVFIGPTEDSLKKVNLNSLSSQKNIYVLGYRKYKVLPFYCAYFDIGWIPLKKSNYTRDMFPMKFFEYLAAGLPVVSTSIDSLKGFEDVALFSNNDEVSMSKNIHQALSLGDHNLQQRLDKAKANTYALRTKKMLTELKLI